MEFREGVGKSLARIGRVDGGAKGGGGVGCDEPGEAREVRADQGVGDEDIARAGRRRASRPRRW